MKPMPGTTIKLISVIIKSIMFQLLYSSLKRLCPCQNERIGCWVVTKNFVSFWSFSFLKEYHRPSN